MDGNSTNGSGSVFVSRHRNDSSSFIRRENEIVIAERRGDGTNFLQTSDTNQETNEDLEIEEKILTVYWRAGKLGAAYFTLQTGELYILEEIVDRPPSHLMLANLFRQVDPGQVLLDGKDQSTFAGALKELVFDNDGQGDGRCKLVFLKSKENSFEACKRRILSLSLPNEPKPCSEEERTMFLRTVVDFSQTQSVHALGALLRYVDLNWSSLAMDLHSKPEFMCLRRISLTDIVTIDEDTYKGLQIFSSIAHPSNFKKGVQGSNKEGMSLYHLFNKCSSKVGQSRLRVLLQHPSNNLEVLKRRQDVVAFFMRGQNDSLLRNICSCLRYVRNVTGILAKIKALSAKPFQWKSLYNTLYNTVLICEMCESVSEASEFLAELGSYDNTKLYEMALYMNRIIDFDSSKTERKFTVKPGVDPELDKKKQIMANLHGLMSETAKIELSRLPQFVQECAMVYMPHLGYLLAVKLWQDNLTAEEKEIPNLRFMFQNNDYIHYKSKGCEELDVLIGDTWPEIVAHETRLMMRLSDLILQSLHALHDPIDKCAELDCLIAISKVCREHNFVRPTMVADKIIDIKQGRHPLHALSCDSFVPNNLVSSRDGSLVKILTGPNASGKSVYMKQIGLIVYLAHIGSFVPAESATIGVLSHIHTRVQSTETIAAHMSAFLIDLRQMSLALQESTSNSLILIDEFGKGTSEVDGIALLASCINSVLCREENCPHVLVATHMLQLPEYIISTPLVRFQQFEHLLQEDGEAVFLFRLTDGSVNTSFAHQVATSSGIERHIVDRAKHVMECLMNNSLPKENNQITTKLKTFIQIIKNDLLTENI